MEIVHTSFIRDQTFAGFFCFFFHYVVIEIIKILNHCNQTWLHGLATVCNIYYKTNKKNHPEISHSHKRTTLMSGQTHLMWNNCMIWKSKVPVLNQHVSSIRQSHVRCLCCSSSNKPQTRNLAPKPDVIFKHLSI